MRKLLLATALALAFPAVAVAAPCVPGSLTSYFGLGSGGCDVGSATFFDFTSGPSLVLPSADVISPSDITVTPAVLVDGAQLAFSMDQSVDVDGFLGILIGYSVAALGSSTFGAATLDLTGAAATGDGDVTVVEDVCLGGVFSTGPSDCQGAPDTLAVAQLPEFSTSPDSLSFIAPASFFDVFVDLGIASNGAGTAALNGAVTTQFTGAAAPAAVPEPMSLLLVGSGLLGLAARARRKRH